MKGSKDVERLKSCGKVGKMWKGRKCGKVGKMLKGWKDVERLERCGKVRKMWKGLKDVENLDGIDRRDRVKRIVCEIKVDHTDYDC